jgi:hypothetical protein
MSHRTRTAPDCELVEGAPDSNSIERGSCERRLSPLALVAGIVPALIIASAILSLVRATG